MTASVPRVAIILPVRNGAGTLPRALASVVGQTFPHWELWAIDDGSSDVTAAILAAWSQRDPRIHVLVQPPRGIVAALQAGITASATPLVARFDADDEMAPTRLAEQVAALTCHPDWALVGSLVSFGGNPWAARGYALHVEWANSVVAPEQIALRRFVESPFAHPSVMFRRDAVARWGGYREGDFPEDYELWLRWLDAGARMGKVPAPLLVWHDPPGRLSRTDRRYALAAFYRLKAVYLARELVRRLDPPRAVWVWGAGRLTRRRVDYLKAEGIAVAGYIDIDGRKQGRTTADGVPVIAPEQLPPPGERFVLGYVSSRGARELIAATLVARSYREGQDFLLCA